jgi:Ras-related protein Rab-1A
MLDIDKFAKEGVLRFLVGNKCDLEHKRQISTDQGKELAKQYGIPFIETSAKDTVNIDELFLGITKNFLEKQTSNIIKKDVKSNKNMKNNKPISVEKLSEPSKKKKGCC